MRIYTIAVALLLSAVSALAADASGIWAVTIDAPTGAVDATLTLKQDGEKLTGTFTNARGETPLTGTMKGDDLSVSISAPVGTLVITAKVTEGKMEGSLDYAGQAQVPLKGTKK
jgi:hypothetical protein